MRLSASVVRGLGRRLRAVVVQGELAEDAVEIVLHGERSRRCGGVLFFE